MKSQNGSQYKKLKENMETELNYQPHEAEGQCTMQSIIPVKFVSFRFVLYIISNVILFIPLLLTYWNDKYKKMFYMKFCSLQESTHFYILNYDDQVSIVKKQSKLLSFDEKNRAQRTYFVNRYMTYYIDQQNTVKLSVYNYHERIKEISQEQRLQTGLTTHQSLELKDTFGLGTMIIKKPTLLQLTIDQLIKPLYIFLVFGVLFWYIAENYLYFATTILVVFIVGVILNLYQIYKLNEKIFSMAYYQIMVNVLRNGAVKKISSLEIVPGDIVFLRDPIKLSFQGIILQGSILINQCALTGQSVPVVKKADRFDKMAQNPSLIDKNAFVFEGTTIVQVNDKKPMSKFQKFRQDYGIPVCVVKTNFVTTKGQLIRIILFPKQQENSFQRESAKFLLVLLLIAIVSYTVLIIINFQFLSTYDIIIKLIDLILIAVPPALPVSMTFGIIYALQRLQQKKIFCIAQNKVITGGIIEFACFDKTGTLTEDYMDFYCVVPSYAGKFHTQVVNTQQMSDYMIQNISKKPYYLPVLNNMAANHSIIKIQATNQLIGDPMEIKSFRFGKFELNQSNVEQQVIFGFQSQRNHKGSVYRRYQFESDLQRMSVIITSNLTEGFYVYTKGSPQMMATIMQKSSIPKNYNQILKEYASHGFRVLAIASKSISAQQMKQATRQKIQSNLIFNGFQVFQNPLKKETTGAIKQLKQAKIGCVMITGDNTLTGSNISYKCNISQRQKGMIVIDLIEGKLVEETFVFHDYQNTKAFPPDKPIAQSYIEEDIRISLMSKQRSSKRHSSLKESSHVSGFQPMKDNHEEFMFNLTIKSEENHCQLCITGRAFNQLFPGAVNNLTLVQKKFMEKATVFARTKPNDKAKIVMVFQQMGKKVSMCGDGANDCGALKQADIGLSLSQAQASISAPFTSQITNITSMVEVLKQCRAGLATNFSLFNIMAIYSLTQFSTTIITQLYLGYPADFQFLYWDIVCNFIMIIFVGYTATAKVLSIQKPRNSLFCFTNLFQVIFMFIVQFASQYIAIVLYSKVQPSYYKQYGGIDNGRSYYDNNELFNLDGVQTSILFGFTNNVYLFTLLAFNISNPWRKGFYTNIPLVCSAVLIFAYNTLLFFDESLRLEILSMHYWPSTQVQLVVYLWSFSVSLFLYVNQKCILQPLSRKLIEKYPKLTWL